MQRLSPFSKQLISASSKLYQQSGSYPHWYPRRHLASAKYEAANSALNSLPEISAAKNAPNASVAHEYLKRAFEIVSHAGDPRLVILAHGRLARHYYDVGLASAERMHRVAMIDILETEMKLDRDDATPALLSASYNGLALSCLRVGDDEYLLAAAAAADAAGRHAASARARLSATLHSALSRPRGSESQSIMLSAITAGAGFNANGLDPVDLPGFARFYEALFAKHDSGGPKDTNALTILRHLVNRWQAKDNFDLIEVECALGTQLVNRGSAESENARYAEAEDVLSSALSRARRVGTEIDCCEPYLAIARLYTRMRRHVEAEGLYRNIDENFTKLLDKKALSVMSADLFCRATTEYAELMGRVGRRREAEVLRNRIENVRKMFPEILSHTPHVPMWTVDSCIRQYDLPNPAF